MYTWIDKNFIFLKSDEINFDEHNKSNNNLFTFSAPNYVVNNLL
jgi:hypothetical protein